MDMKILLPSRLSKCRVSRAYAGVLKICSLMLTLSMFVFVSGIPSAEGKLVVEGVNTDATKKAADEKKFNDLLKKCEDESPAFKNLRKRVVDSDKTITAKVGRSLPNVVVDLFKSNEIDLDDLETFPNPTKKVKEEAGQVKVTWEFPAGFPAWAETICETIAHVLGER